FTAPTAVRWQVSQDGLVAGSGTFVAARGRQYHFVAAPLTHRLRPGTDGAVALSTANGRVATVHRAPGCTFSSAATSRLAWARSRLARVPAPHAHTRAAPPPPGKGACAGVGAALVVPGSLSSPRAYRRRRITPRRCGPSTDLMVTLP